ncbi:hypothetical protein EOD39_18777 [Acipenser ruthenus]|uniref:Uncharacterized protein n=1 Tax=Acipenser ruthenus TaxID=7906 RepID=A0A444V001_ACIRT|nr:hypothetical protein EOD39_18777 [Acipenser ruthenus]
MGRRSRQRQQQQQHQKLLPPQLEDPASLFPWCSWCGKVDHRWRSCPKVPPADWCGRCEVYGHNWAGCPYALAQEEADDDGELFLKSLAAELCTGCRAYGHTVAICPTQTEGRRRKQRGRKTWEEKEWCTQCMQYGHEEHHCPEVLPDTDLEWEEPECPAPEWEEPERPAPEWEEPERPAPEWEEPERPEPKRGESVRPEPKRGKAQRPQSRCPPAEGEFLLVLPPSPSPAEGACLLVPLLLPSREPEEVELPSREPEGVELPSREPEGVEPRTREPEGEEPWTREPEGEKAEAPQQSLHMLLRGAQGRRTRLRRQEVAARLQRPL